MGGPVNISYPGGGPDVTRRNKNDILYIKGDENTDGSIRLIFSDKEFAGIQLRAGGVFNDTSFRISSSSLQVGLDLTISAAASFIETFNPSIADEHQRALVPHITFDDSGTATSPHTAVLKPLDPSVIFGPAISQVTSTSIGINFNTTHARIIETLFHEVGTIGATQPVKHSIYVGTDNTGLLIKETNLGINKVLADQPLALQFNRDVGLRNNSPYFIELTSPVAFSLKTDSGGNPLLAFLEQELGILNMVTENLIWNNDLNHVLNNSLDPVYSNQFPHSVLTSQN